MSLQWVWLDEPTRQTLTNTVVGVPADPPCLPGKGQQWVVSPEWDYVPVIPCPAAVLCDDGEVRVYGHVEGLGHDSGCGCCSSDHDWKIVAWAPIEIEAPVRP